MDINDFEEVAFQGLVTDIKDQIASLTRQLKLQYVKYLKLKMRVAYIGEGDLISQDERDSMEILPQNIEAMENEIQRHQERLRKIKSG